MARVVGNANLLKNLNRHTVLNAIRKAQPVSRAALMAETGLALPTILRNVDTLIGEGYVIEVGKADAKMGRKPTMLEINPVAGHILGVDIGRKLKLALADFQGNLLAEREEILDFSYELDWLAQRVWELANTLVTDNHLSMAEVAGVGFSMPGMDFKRREQGGELTDFSGWNARDSYDKILSNFAGMLTVAEHNTICGAIGEQWFGATKSYKNSVYLLADKGVGSGIVIDGKLYCGRDGFAGHLGHTIVQAGGELCYCGNRGCLECYASSGGIVRRVRKALEAGEASSLTPEHTDFAAILEAAARADTLCGRILSEAGTYLGIGVANIINMLNPDIVVLGGAVCNSIPQIAETICACARDRVFSNRARTTPIVPSELAGYSEIKGAIALVMDQIFSYHY